MISRRRILSRSRDDLTTDSGYHQPEEEEDVWYQKEKLYKDHIHEVLEKWHQIEDEIWAKVILFERNRRIAKAYARAPVLTINGSEDGFDGFRIGLNGFDNPMRDKETQNFKRLIEHGVKVKMDDQGNILIKRVSNKCKVFVKSTSPNEETSIGAEVLKLQNGTLEPDKPYKLFDMNKFQQNVTRELQRAYPDRRRLECQCLSTIIFVKNEKDLLGCPVWVMIINVVALDMLKSKLPPVQRGIDIRNRPRIPIPDEDPYSVAGGGSVSGTTGTGSGSSGGSSGGGPPVGFVAAAREQLLQQQRSRGDKPPQLPPRDNYPHEIPKPDYDDDEETTGNKLPSRLFRPFQSSRNKDKSKDNKKHDDPYYCGLSARVPNFVKLNQRSKNGKDMRESVRGFHQPPVLPSPSSSHYQHSYQPHSLWHARSYESGMDSDHLESPYNQIYGRLPLPTRPFIPSQPRAMFVGEWD